MRWYFTALRNATNFHWRAHRREFWGFWGVSVGLFLLLLFLELFMGVAPLRLSGLFALLMLLPGLSVTVRRMHDMDRSGAWALLFLVPVIGWIVLAVMALRPGIHDENEYGPDPRRARPIPLMPR